MPKMKPETRFGKNYVYFIYEGMPEDVSTATIFKMGFSHEPRKRISSLQTGNMRQLSIYRLIECPDRKFAKALEYVLHKNFISVNSRGEWFQITALEINQICATVIDLIASGLPLEFFEDIPLGVNHDDVETTIRTYDDCVVCSGLPDVNFGDVVSNMRVNLNTQVEYTRTGDVNIITAHTTDEDSVRMCLQTLIEKKLI